MEYSLKPQTLLPPPIKFTHRPSSSRSSTVFLPRGPHIIPAPRLSSIRTVAAATQPPPTKDNHADKAAVAVQPPPSEDSPAPALKNPPVVIQIIEDFNKTYGPLGEFNKLLKSFKFYSPVIGPFFGALKLMWDWTKKNNASFQRLKMLASKYGAYLAIIAVIVATATIVWLKKKQPGTGPGFGQGGRSTPTTNS